MSQNSSFMDSFQRLIDRINEKYGGIGSIIGVALWVIVFIYSLGALLGGILGH